MSYRLPLRPSPIPATLAPAAGTAPADATSSGRLVRVGLALHLLPALAIVVVAGGLGMLVLAGWRLVAEIGGGRDSDPPSKAGLEAIRA
jgi:hypothetical protein